MRRFYYRPLMRFLHRFNLHYAPPNHALTNDGGWPMHWCEWCGMRDFVMDFRAFKKAGGLDIGGEQVRGIKRASNNPVAAKEADQ